MTETLSAKEARRIALAAQGFADARPRGAITKRHLMKVLEHTQLLQLDSVSVVVRAHYLPLFSRLGAYPQQLLDEAAWGRRPTLFEAWAHEASILPLETFPLLRWRQARAMRGEGVWKSMATAASERRHMADAILEHIRKNGPTATSDLEDAKGKGGWWGWSHQKGAMEWLYRSGQVAAKTRRSSFEREYDLTERVIPPDILDRPLLDEAEAQRRLLRLAARSLGVATAGDLRDYFRLSGEDAKARIPELIEAGDITPVKVKGWSQQAYLAPGARLPRKVGARALLAPFDPIVWERSRTERLFGVRIRLEIYTPAEKRTHGYYVLPFLLGEAIAARVDLKSDRSKGVLRVLAAHREPSAPADTADELAAELRLMADWLGLERLAVDGKGDLAADLADAVARLG